MGQQVHLLNKSSRVISYRAVSDARSISRYKLGVKEESTSFLICIICMLAFAMSTLTETVPQNVLDYYLLLPSEYLTIGGSADERLKAIKVKDVKNGYLRIEGDWEGHTEVALFRNSDRSALIAVSDVHFGPGPEQKMHFLQYLNGRWIDKTEQVLPRVSKEKIASAYLAKKGSEDDDFGDDVPHVYLLSRVGTTIAVVTAPGFTAVEFTLLELKWKNGRFEIADPAPATSFKGRWTFEDKQVSFELTLEQNENEIIGTYSYVTLPNAARIREGRIEGVVRGGLAEIYFENQEHEWERGRATITASGANLIWKITERPKGESFLPGEATLVRAKSKQ